MVIWKKSWLLGSIDVIYGVITGRNKFFRHGFRNLQHIDQIKANLKVAPVAHPIQLKWTTPWVHEKNVVYREASFVSLPLSIDYVPIFEICKTAHFQIVIPKQYFNETEDSEFPFDKKNLSLCIQLPSTGDQEFEFRRQQIGWKLAENNIGSVILQCAYYGKRRPEDQNGAAINTITDLVFLGYSILEEARSLQLWLRNGVVFQGKLGVTGISMGGNLAAYVGLLSSEPIAISSCIGSHAPTPIFTDGALSKRVPFDVLAAQLGHNIEEEARDYLKAFLEDFVMKWKKDLDMYKDVPKSYCQLSARHDQVVPLYSMKKLWALFSENKHIAASLEWIDGGHVSSFVFHKATFIKTIVKSFELLDKVLKNQ